ncbi:hypothetical protein [Neorhizobium petrolearium]|uniref:Uncharacterized protein n=1 Tax=Neorhizobium petrolearium TaxID=515361 RepID=A0ABY8M296_9HYPH|nr:hypothetical protein [Neorhizobium petrolearium]MCC2612651.1 hypothetical protein [Neorhizobium petrolearium]WGI67774.1 hypothetical protein QEO92_22760 [Neorhizobium petrolearium]
MTFKALVKTADLKRMASVAKSENVTIELEVDGVIVRVKPNEVDDDRKHSALPDDFAL